MPKDKDRNRKFFSIKEYGVFWRIKTRKERLKEKIKTGRVGYIRPLRKPRTSSHTNPIILHELTTHSPI